MATQRLIGFPFTMIKMKKYYSNPLYERQYIIKETNEGFKASVFLNGEWQNYSGTCEIGSKGWYFIIEGYHCVDVYKIIDDKKKLEDIKKSAEWHLSRNHWGWVEDGIYQDPKWAQRPDSKYMKAESSKVWKNDCCVEFLNSAKFERGGKLHWDGYIYSDGKFEGQIINMKREAVFNLLLQIYEKEWKYDYKPIRYS